MKHLAVVLLAAATLAGCASSTGEQASSAPGAGSVTAGSQDAGGGQQTPELASALADVERVAVRLESYYRGNPYPTTVEQAIASLDGAGLSLSPGNSVGSYVYDPDRVEFTLCVQNASGAWGTYDTAPMSLREAGETGGCPAT